MVSGGVQLSLPRYIAIAAATDETTRGCVCRTCRVVFCPSSAWFRPIGSVCPFFSLDKQVKKLQESQNKTQAALKRKMEEHSMAMRKVKSTRELHCGLLRQRRFARQPPPFFM